MALVACPACDREVSDQAATCVGCGHPLGAARRAAQLPVYEPLRVLGVLGALCFAWGAFAPILRAPLIGSFSAMSGDGRFGLLLLATAIVAAVCALRGARKATLVTGVIALLEVLFLFARLRGGIEAGPGLGAPAVDSATSELVQLEYGFLVLFVGAALVIAYGLRARASDDTSGPSEALLQMGRAVLLRAGRLTRRQVIPIAVVVAAAAAWYVFLRPGAAEERESRSAVEALLRYERQYHSDNGTYRSGRFEPQLGVDNQTLDVQEFAFRDAYQVIAEQSNRIVAERGRPAVTCGAVLLDSGIDPSKVDMKLNDRRMIYDGKIRCGADLVGDR